VLGKRLVFDTLLFNLRTQGLAVGVSEWLRFVDGLKRGLATDLDQVYSLGRCVLVHSEADYDSYDLAFAATFEGVTLDPKYSEALELWLQDPKAFDEAREAGLHNFENLDQLMEALRKILEEQNERHDGGNRWVGTGGTSPWGHSGKANTGVRIGGEGGGRSAVRVAGERRWRNYRTDISLDVRDFKVALRTLRHLIREGREVLDLDETIDQTSKNAGEIELVYQKERANRVRLVLLMDAGGSMSPHTALVSRLFSAATETKIFKSFEHYYFHNCVYQWLYRDFQNYDRVATAEVLKNLTHEHRLIFVGDASMATWELMSPGYALAQDRRRGIDWVHAFAKKCPGSIWLNPDPERFWNHPTVRAIGDAFEMYPLTLDGLRKGIQHLRAPR